jgi:hypothetical protein
MNSPDDAGLALHRATPGIGVSSACSLGQQHMITRWRDRLYCRRPLGDHTCPQSRSPLQTNLCTTSLLATDAELNVVPAPGCPEFADYQAVDGLLNTVMPAALTMLTTDTLGVLAQDAGKIGRLLAFWDIRHARDLAWDSPTTCAASLASLTHPVDTACLVPYLFSLFQSLLFIGANQAGCSTGERYPLGRTRRVVTECRRGIQQ